MAGDPGPDTVDAAEDVTVVIPTIGRPVLARCLEALAAGSARPAKVVIVDQGGDSTTAAIIAAAVDAGLACDHVVSSQRGAAAGRNRGIERVDTRFFAAIDDDCLPEPDWLARLASCLRKHPADVTTGQVLPVGGAESAPSLITAPAPEVHTRALLGRDVLYTGNMGVGLETFRRVGLLNEAKILRNAAEDNEWAYRALREGVPIRYEPAVRVRHLDWRDAEQLAAVERRYARGQGGFYGLYLRRGDLFVARRVVHDLTRWLRRAARGIVRRDARMALRGIFGGAELCFGVVAGLTTRPETPARRPEG